MGYYFFMSNLVKKFHTPLGKSCLYTTKNGARVGLSLPIAPSSFLKKSFLVGHHIHHCLPLPVKRHYITVWYKNYKITSFLWISAVSTDLKTFLRKWNLRLIRVKKGKFPPLIPINLAEILFIYWLGQQ